MINIKLSSTEAQILVDELNRAIRSTKKSNAKYALEAQELRDKILKAASKNGGEYFARMSHSL